MILTLILTLNPNPNPNHKFNPKHNPEWVILKAGHSKYTKFYYDENEIPGKSTTNIKWSTKRNTLL